MGAPFFFVLFGVVFVGAAITGVVFNLYNATSRNRFSHLDIVRRQSEIDPLDEMLTSGHDRDHINPRPSQSHYCPSCGTPASSDFQFCPKCGNQLP